MRDIKFRAWHNVNNVMLENAHIYDDFCQMVGSKKDTYTIEQFTGLKDKNGNEIYEGDIMQYNFPNEVNKPFEILWFQFGWGFKYKGWDGPAYMNPFNIEHGEVIGNIHENPDLL